MGGCQACSPFPLANDRPASRFDLDAGPDGVAIARGSLQAQANPVMSRLGVVAQQGRAAVLMVDDQVDVAVVVEVAVGDALGRRDRSRSRVRRGASRVGTVNRRGCGAAARARA